MDIESGILELQYKSANSNNNPVVFSSTPNSLPNENLRRYQAGRCLFVTIDPISTVDTVDTVGVGLLFEALTVKWAATTSQAVCSLLGRDVALRLSQHLVADLELPDSCTAEQGWVEVDVKMAALDLIVCTFQRRLVDTHAYICVSHVLRSGS